MEAIAAGYTHSMALKSDGTVWAWGWNAYGQLGDGTNYSRYIPVQVASSGAPQWPESDVLTVTDVTYNRVQLSWQPATDETGVDKYKVYQDNTLLTTLNGDVNSYKVRGLSPKSTYLFSLVAVDAASNQSMKKDVRVTTLYYHPALKPETLLYRFDGTILDFDQSHIIWKETGNKALWLYNRADKSQVKIYDAAGSDYIILTAKLSADGVVYSLSGGTGAVHYWKDGAVQNSWDDQTLHEANGNFVVFSGSVVDVTTGESRTLPNSNFKNTNRFDLSADGTVVYTDPTYQSDLYKSLPDGALTTYVSPSPNYFTYSGALTDGKNIIYKVLMLYNGNYSKWSIRVRSSDDQITTIAMNPFDADQFVDPREYHQINNGWIAKTSV